MSPNLEFDPKVTYDISLRRLVNLAPRAKTGLPMIEPEEAAAPQAVTITAASGAAIYYTLDGSLPVAGAAGTTLYTAPITITEAATLRVVAVEAGKAPSNVATASYT